MVRVFIFRLRRRRQAGFWLIVTFAVLCLIELVVDQDAPAQAIALYLPCEPRVNVGADSHGNARYWYSDTYGWFDTSHFGAGNPRKLIADVGAAITNGGGYILVKQDVRDGLMGYTAYYYVSDNISQENIIPVALGIFMDWSVRFEEWQQQMPHGLAAQFTSFAIEDLPSHYIGFFAAANQMEYASVFTCYLGIASATNVAPPHLQLTAASNTSPLPAVSKLQNRTFVPMVQNEAGRWVHVSWPKRMRIFAATADEGMWRFISDKTWYFDK